MRVALVVNRYPVPSQTFIETQIRGLLARGVECHVVDKAAERSQQSPDIDEEHVHRLRVTGEGGIGSRLAGQAVTLALRHPGRSLAHLRALARWRRSPLGSHWITLDRLTGVAPDVVHYSFASYALGDEHLPELLGVPLVVSCRGFDLTHVGKGDRTTYRRLWTVASFVHFRSTDLLEIARARGFDDRRPHAVTPPGIDASYFSPLEPSHVLPRQAAPVVVSIGRLVKKKGHEVGLEVVSELRRRGLELRYKIVGEGEREEELRTIARALGIEDAVDFLGVLPPSEVRAVLRGADVLLHPSWQEGFGVSVLEAQAVGVPVVCSDAEGLAENIADGVTGFLTRTGDVRSMAQHVERLLTDEGLRRRMGEAGRVRVLRGFSVDREIQSYIDSYEAVRRRQDGA